jgi:hypothetical protein
LCYRLSVRPRAFSFVVFASALALAAPAALLFNPGAPRGTGVPEARAAVSVLLSLDELLGASAHVVVVTAGESRSVWEDLPGGRRIVTYTKLQVERSLGGASPGEAVEVRTLGGVVGSIGQAVEGDAKLAKGERAVVFLGKGERAFVVAGLAQGHFPLRADEKGTVRLAPSPKAGSLLPRPGPAISAREELVGASLEDAALRIERARKARDGR